MTWADIAAGLKPTVSAPTTTNNESAAPPVPIVPVIQQAAKQQPVPSITAGLASMSVNDSRESGIRAPAVGTKATQAQANPKQNKNRRHGGKKRIDEGNGKDEGRNPSTTGIALEKFHLFPDLPVELRFKIWRFSMAQRRLIELERGPNMDIPTGLGNGSHYWVRVCPRSRRPPAIMHVCRESREEAEKVYTLRCFDCRVSHNLPDSPELHEHYIWYNPQADIIFFGEDTCVSSYITVFGGNIEDIPAVAIVGSGKGETCCDHDDEAYGVDGGVDTMQALHGFDPSETLHDTRYGGCPGLKEVFIIVKSKLLLLKQGMIDDSITLRPTTNEGLTKGQISFKARFERRIARVEAEIPLPGVGENVWTGDQKPTFKFVSFAPIACGVDPREYDGMTVSRKNLWELRRGDWAFIKRTEAVTGCEIIIPDEEYPREDPREIGFHGVRKSIDAAKKAINEKLVALSSKTRGN